MKIRTASIKDLKQLYDLGLKTPELQVSATEVFMDKDDFTNRIKDKDHVFLLAEENNTITGFICANAKDADRPLKNKYACIVYLVVAKEFREKGLAKQLYTECLKQLKKRGITHVYSLVNGQSKPIQKFFIKQGFSKGHPLIWMDKKI